MKNILYLILLISVSLIFESCSDDSEDILPLNPSFTLSDCIPQNGFPSTASIYAEMVKIEENGKPVKSNQFSAWVTPARFEPATVTFVV